jgi:hypothetical protein
MQIYSIIISIKPLINLIKPDYSKWKPRKLEDRIEMYKIHNLDMAPNAKENFTYENQVG